MTQNLSTCLGILIALLPSLAQANCDQAWGESRIFSWAVSMQKMEKGNTHVAQERLAQFNDRWKRTGADVRFSERDFPLMWNELGAIQKSSIEWSTQNTVDVITTVSTYRTPSSPTLDTVMTKLVNHYSDFSKTDRHAVFQSLYKIFPSGLDSSDLVSAAVVAAILHIGAEVQKSIPRRPENATTIRNRLRFLFRFNISPSPLLREKLSRALKFFEKTENETVDQAFIQIAINELLKTEYQTDRLVQKAWGLSFSDAISLIRWARTWKIVLEPSFLISLLTRIKMFGSEREIIKTTVELVKISEYSSYIPRPWLVFINKQPNLVKDLTSKQFQELILQFYRARLVPALELLERAESGAVSESRPNRERLYTYLYASAASKSKPSREILDQLRTTQQDLPLSTKKSKEIRDILEENSLEDYLDVVANRTTHRTPLGQLIHDIRFTWREFELPETIQRNVRIDGGGPPYPLGVPEFRTVFRFVDRSHPSLAEDRLEDGWRIIVISKAEWDRLPDQASKTNYLRDLMGFPW